MLYDRTLKEMNTEMIQHMKSDLLKSVEKIEVLEGKLLEKEAENDHLKKEIKTLNTKIYNRSEKT